MKGNPFYFGSAAAMLAGCYILSQALALEPGHVAKLLVLMGVVQVYECLLVKAGLFLVTTKRAPKDGLTLLALESVFLLDATLLANECATADLWTGTIAALVTLALAGVKLMLVAREAPHVLSSRTSLYLILNVGLALALPVVAAHLASVRLLSPASLYACSWVMLALPFLRRAQLAELGRNPSVAERVWAVVPMASVLGHFLAVAWVHDVPFQPALIAPLLLGFAFAKADGSWRELVTFTAAALLVSVAQFDALGFQVFGVPVAPPQLVLVAAGIGLSTVAWRRGSRALLASAGGLTTLGLLGDQGLRSVLSAAGDLLGQAFRLLADLAPSAAVAWGILVVISAFVLLALGLRRSLEKPAPVNSQKEGQ
jgi:hypothetical protein